MDTQNNGRAVISDFEVLDLNNGSANTVTLDTNAVQTLTGTAAQNDLMILADTNDTVDLTGFTANGMESNGLGTFDVYESTANSGTRVLVEQGTASVSFDNPFTQELSGTVAIPMAVETAGAGDPAHQGDDVITLALYTGSGDEIVTGGPVFEAFADSLQNFESSLASFGVSAKFEILTNGAGSYDASVADIQVGLGDQFFDAALTPSEYLGLTQNSVVDTDGDGVNSSVLFSDEFLKLANMDGLEAGSLAKYVIGQELGHALGLDEFTDAQLADMGLDPATAHEYTTLDETVDGLSDPDQLGEYEFASDPGADGFELLAQALLGADIHTAELGAADSLSGAAGENDIFRFEDIDHQPDTITTFEQGEDSLDLSGLIEGFDPVQDSLDEFVIQTQSEQGLEIAIDADGAAGPQEARELVTIEGLTSDLAEGELALGLE